MRIGRCYVCGKPLSSAKEKKVSISPTLWRHESCQPGSQKWLNSEQAKGSEFTKLFIQNKKENT